MKLFMDKKPRITGDIAGQPEAGVLKEDRSKAARKRAVAAKKAPRRLPAGRCCCDDGCSSQADAQTGKIFAALSARLTADRPGRRLGRGAVQRRWQGRVGRRRGAAGAGAQKDRCRGQGHCCHSAMRIGGARGTGAKSDAEPVISTADCAAIGSVSPAHQRFLRGLLWDKPANRAGWRRWPARHRKTNHRLLRSQCFVGVGVIRGSQSPALERG